MRHIVTFTLYVLVIFITVYYHVIFNRVSICIAEYTKLDTGPGSYVYLADLHSYFSRFVLFCNLGGRNRYDNHILTQDCFCSGWFSSVHVQWRGQ